MPGDVINRKPFTGTYIFERDVFTVEEKVVYISFSFFPLCIGGNFIFECCFVDGEEYFHISVCPDTRCGDYHQLLRLVRYLFQHERSIQFQSGGSICSGTSADISGFNVHLTPEAESRAAGFVSDLYRME